ncbi:DUF4160 domain-containing protein [Thermus tengchongensis]|uniref:DUF4160 domain-containing protein n=1 Tax=Thermus tengchongensis TaxID=1214928 RepID=UPI001F3324C9|nr:DUF4160 domain-containing protein [Thermus tengchongensis]
MPRLSRFYGIAVAMFYDDHPPPHFHARYGDHEALIGIVDLRVLAGSLPPKAMALVVEWALLHQGELMDNWHRARRREPLVPIPPLV